jgi:hypothetical protein
MIASALGLGVLTSMRSDDLATLFLPPQATALADAAESMSYLQGLVVAFDANTGENTIRTSGGVYSNLPLLNTAEATSLRAGHTVGIHVVGRTAYIVGRVMTPGSDGFAPSALVIYNYPPDLSEGQLTNFSLSSTTDSVLIEALIPVPEWADQVNVMVFNNITIVNTGPAGATAPFIARTGCRLASAGSGGGGGSMQTSVDNGEAASLSAMDQRSFVNPAGESIRIQARAWGVGTTFNADVRNLCALNAVAFFRNIS